MVSQNLATALFLIGVLANLQQSSAANAPSNITSKSYSDKDFLFDLQQATKLTSRYDASHTTMRRRLVSKAYGKAIDSSVDGNGAEEVSRTFAGTLNDGAKKKKKASGDGAALEKQSSEDADAGVEENASWHQKTKPVIVGPQDELPHNVTRADSGAKEEESIKAATNMINGESSREGDDPASGMGNKTYKRPNKTSEFGPRYNAKSKSKNKKRPKSKKDSKQSKKDSKQSKKSKSQKHDMASPSLAVTPTATPTTISPSFGPSKAPTTLSPSFKPSKAPTYLVKEELVLSVLKSNLPTESYDAISDRLAPTLQNEALNWVLYTDTFKYDWAGLGEDPPDAHAEMDFMQRYSLVTFHTALSGSEWRDNTGWKTEAGVCEWYGVKCHVVGERGTNEGHTSERTLQTMVGAVKSLQMEENELYGWIPQDIAVLTSLEDLELHHNELQGEIPPQLYGISTLKNLLLGGNSLGGPISTGIGQLVNLEYFDVETNRFDGPFPTEIGNLGELRELVVGQNYFDSSMPTEIGNLTKLRNLTANDNLFEGQIPDELTGLLSLVQLNLHNNLFDGTIPTLIGNMESLATFTARNNKRRYSKGLSGNLPESIGLLTELKEFDVGDNSITGEIPTTLGQCANLFILFLQDNKLEGDVPSELGNLINMKAVNLKGNNKLEGEIPQSLCDAEVKVEVGGSVQGCCTRKKPNCRD